MWADHSTSTLFSNISCGYRRVVVIIIKKSSLKKKFGKSYVFWNYFVFFKITDKNNICSVMSYQSKRYCPVVVVQQGGGQCISPWGGAFLYVQNRTIPFGLIVHGWKYWHASGPVYGSSDSYCLWVRDVTRLALPFPPLPLKRDEVYGRALSGFRNVFKQCQASLPSSWSLPLDLVTCYSSARRTTMHCKDEFWDVVFQRHGWILSLSKLF